VRPVSSSAWLDRPLRVGTPEILAETRANYSTTGRPIACALIGGALVVAPAPDATYTLELQYFEKLVPLSTSAATNSVLAESPDLYLYGALLHSAPYLSHDERIETWETRFEKALAQLEAAARARRDQRQHSSGTTPP
jgi:hypothetical protein